MICPRCDLEFTCDEEEKLAAAEAKIAKLKAALANAISRAANKPSVIREPKYDEENYREQMKDAGRGHLLR